MEASREERAEHPDGSDPQPDARPHREADPQADAAADKSAFAGADARADAQADDADAGALGPDVRADGLLLLLRV